MKNDYEVRALKFARVLVRLFEGCFDIYDFVNVIDDYNATHSRPIRYDHGVSRIAILRADYVIKFNIAPTERWDNGYGSNLAGDNSTEEEIYNRAVRDGFAYLLAKTTVVSIGGRDISIMPLVHGVGDENKYFGDHCTDEEFRWLTYNICDLHEGNLGYYRGKPVVIDYAWDNG